MDFNDAKITQQEKEDILHQQIDKDYKRLREKYGFEPFKAYWILNYESLKVLNDDAYTNEGVFDFYKDDIAKFDPQMNCVLYEGHRIKKGEWDRFYNCWSDRDYIRCQVGFFAYKILGITEEDFATAVYFLEKDEDGLLTEESIRRINDYPNTWNVDGSPKRKGHLGIIEFNPSILDEVEKRCKEINSELNVEEDSVWSIGRRPQIIWSHTERFDESVQKRINDSQTQSADAIRERIGKNKKSRKKLGKSLKKGFSL